MQTAVSLASRLFILIDVLYSLVLLLTDISHVFPCSFVLNVVRCICSDFILSFTSFSLYYTNTYRHYLFVVFFIDSSDLLCRIYITPHNIGTHLYSIKKEATPLTFHHIPTSPVCPFLHHQLTKTSSHHLQTYSYPLFCLPSVNRRLAVVISSNYTSGWRGTLHTLHNPTRGETPD